MMKTLIRHSAFSSILLSIFVAVSAAQAQQSSVSKPGTKAARPVPKAAFAHLVSLAILPASISLAGPNAAQRVVVEGTFSDGHQEDLTGKSKTTSSNPELVRIDDQGFVEPVADGKATLRATVEDA